MIYILVKNLSATRKSTDSFAVVALTSYQVEARALRCSKREMITYIVYILQIKLSKLNVNSQSGSFMINFIYINFY